VPDSITLDLPSAQRAVRVILGAIGFVVLLLVGVVIGSRILAPEPFTGLVTPGAVQQVRVSSGAVYVGRILSSTGGYVRIAEPAIIRQGDAAAGESAAPRLVVDALTVEPYDTSGELAIVIASIDWVATVRPGSGLEAAYRQATSTSGPAPSASAP
jgi:hypothetical protein